MKCKCNVGGIDRTARIILGSVLLLAGILAPLDMLWRIVILVLAAIALVTALARYCPANALLGIDTSDKKEAPKSES